MFNLPHILHLISIIFVSGWQRTSSYDQLSSFHSTDNHDTASNSSLLSSHLRPSSSKPSSSFRPHARARLSEARTPAPDITNLDLPIPLFSKTDPMQFLDIMKGVSARLDENVGVRPRNVGGYSSSSRAKKRARGVSLRGTSEPRAEKTTSVVKKGRVDELRTSDTLNWDVRKGKSRATFEDENLELEVRGRGLQTHSSLPDIPSRSDLRRSLSSKDVNFMDVDNKDADVDADYTSYLVVSSSSNHGDPDTPFSRTLSQTQMPPPPLACDSFVHGQRQSATDCAQQQSSAPLAVSRHSNSINKPQTSYPLQQQPSTNHSIKQRKPDAIPKLHPLLYHKSSTRVSSSSMSTSTLEVQPQHPSTPILTSEGINLRPPSSSFTPIFSSTPSSRPPPLGMRRNHTFPSRTLLSSTVRQESSSLNGSGGQLPQRQKAFKPPLLSLSQPQAQMQTQGLSQGKADTNVIVVESGSTITTSKKMSSSQNQNVPEASSTDNLVFNATTNIATTLRSSASSSSTSFRSTSPITSPAPSCSHLQSLDSSVKNSNQGMAQRVQQLQESTVTPEPLDGDADSSFGDMSFDMDALEETMKMYD